MKGVDYSWARPGGAAIKEAGFEFAVRYVPYYGDGGKGLTKEELEDLLGAGLSVALVFESTAGRMFDGYPAGMYDASLSHAALLNLGMPEDLPIYFACDVDTTPDQLAYVDDYLFGCAQILGLHRVGVYGEHDVVAHCEKVNSAWWLWQTYAWSRGKVYPHIHLYQYQNGQTLNGGAVDWNEAIQPQFGQWDGDTMTPEEIEALVRKIFDQDFSPYYRKVTRQYWDREAEGAYSAEPDEEVVENIALKVGTVGLPNHRHAIGPVSETGDVII